MSPLTLALWGSSFLLVICLLWRAKTTRLLSRLPLFYSYIAYTFFGSLAILLIYLLRPDLYSHAYWLNYLVRIIAEFAVLAEISDHVFRPFPAIRYVGRLIVLVSAAFSALIILPALSHAASSSFAILALCAWASLAKLVIIGAIILAARYYRLRLTRSTAGLMTGFVIYLSVYATSPAAALAFGKYPSGDVLRFIVPSGWLVCLLTWTVALWRPELSKLTEEKEKALQPQPYLSHQIDRLNDALSRRLGR